MRILAALLFMVLPVSAQSLDFLQGVWTSHGSTTEFHWAERDGLPVLIGRSWAGGRQSCPWCVTETAMAIYYDADSRQVRLHVSDRLKRVRDLRLGTARKGFLEFAGESGERIVFQSMRGDQLSIAFGGVSAITLHRE
jgi:hypothetical protein